ncbi:MAG: pyridoxal-phosphate dependent enzyme [Aquaticitalea sp.]
MTKQHLIDCHKRISPFIHKTPILTSRLINELVDAQLFFKCENFQKMGAFKMRGATNAVMQLSDREKSKGVVTHSSGNFAQALSLAAKSLNVKAFIVMPENAPDVKVKAVEDYGGDITLCESTIESRETTSDKITLETGATFIHPSNDLNVILGNATAGVELLEDQPDLNYVIAPIGGGGLIAGTALAAHFFGTNCKVIGAEPKNVDDAFRSLKSGKIEVNSTSHTIADGLRTHLGAINFPIIQKHVEAIMTVEEHEIVNALKLIYERLKIVIEPSSAVAFAAIIKNKFFFRNKKVGIILSGGNVDLQKLSFIFNEK